MEVKELKTYNFTKGMIELMKGLLMIPREKEREQNLEGLVINALCKTQETGNAAYRVYTDFLQKYYVKHPVKQEALNKKQYKEYKDARAEVFRRYANIYYHTKVEAKK